jgi:hypothetical protein
VASKPDVQQTINQANANIRRFDTYDHAKTKKVDDGKPRKAAKPETGQDKQEKQLMQQYQQATKGAIL